MEDVSEYQPRLFVNMGPILTGKGWYRYEKPGGKEAFVDPEVEQIILQYSRDNGLERRNIPSQV